MSQQFETVIGIEVHVELNTKSKMFCGCSANYFGKEPNTSTCPVCLGLPGALPMINKLAIKDCIKIGLALNCEINQDCYFERKNYFYPDLPKGYQVSQLVRPVAVNGWLDIEGMDGEIKRIRINRAHQEEDTGKLTHRDHETLMDFNRSSVPLVEIVTEPDFSDPYQVRDYAKKLQQIFRYLGVSNADMERGDMRLEANVSVRPKGQKELPPYRVELKNINSFRFMVAAIEYEVKRQIEATEKGEKLHQETRGYDEVKKITYVQRSKEEAHDYRYFPEPDLPELHLHEEFNIPAIKEEISKVLPHNKINNYVSNYGLHPVSAATLVNQGTAQLFEKVLEVSEGFDIDPKGTANFIINTKQDLLNVTPEQIRDDIVAKRSNALDDDVEIERVVQEVIFENPGIVEQYKDGKTTTIQALVGQVMRKTSGRANATKVLTILEKLLA